VCAKGQPRRKPRASRDDCGQFTVTVGKKA
jgi:hypothetical protein